MPRFKTETSEESIVARLALSGVKSLEDLTFIAENMLKQNNRLRADLIDLRERVGQLQAKQKAKRSNYTAELQQKLRLKYEQLARLQRQSQNSSKKRALSLKFKEFVNECVCHQRQIDCLKRVLKDEKAQQRKIMSNLREIIRDQSMPKNLRIASIENREIRRQIVSMSRLEHKAQLEERIDMREQYQLELSLMRSRISSEDLNFTVSSSRVRSKTQMSEPITQRYQDPLQELNIQKQLASQQKELLSVTLKDLNVAQANKSCELKLLLEKETQIKEQIQKRLLEEDMRKPKYMEASNESMHSVEITKQSKEKRSARREFIGEIRVHTAPYELTLPQVSKREINFDESLNFHIQRELPLIAGIKVYTNQLGVAYIECSYIWPDKPTHRNLPPRSQSKQTKSKGNERMESKTLKQDNSDARPNESLSSTSTLMPSSYLSEHCRVQGCILPPGDWIRKIRLSWSETNKCLIGLTIQSKRKVRCELGIVEQGRQYPLDIQSGEYASFLFGCYIRSGFDWLMKGIGFYVTKV